MKTGQVMAFLMIAGILLSGCREKEEIKAMDYVVGVEIDCRYREQTMHRSYEDPDKIDVILHYLYALEPDGRCIYEDPDQLGGDFCKITVKLSQGSSRIYRQQGDRYLSVDSHKWQRIPQSRGKLIFHLVNHIDSD